MNIGRIAPLKFFYFLFWAHARLPPSGKSVTELNFGT